jgi:ketosteroid isomerase-like protein
MSRYLLISAAILLCGEAAHAQTAAKSSTDAAFDAVYSKFSEGYRRADPAMVSALYTSDAFYLQPGRKIERGEAVVQNAFSFLNSYKNKPTGPAIGFQIVDRQVSGDIGWDIGYYFMNGEGKPITANDQPAGKFIVLWKRDTTGQWKIFADGYSGVNPEPAPSAERVAAEKAVVRAVNAYFDGIMNNDSVQLDIAFHPDAELSATLPNGQIYRAPYSQWRKFTTRPKGDPAGKVNHIARVDIMGNAAVATTVLDWPTVRYVDYLSLIKTGPDEWKIVSKVWHQESKAAAPK